MRFMEQLPSIEAVAVMDGHDLDAALWAAEQVRRTAEATIAAITARCDETMHYGADGHRSAKSWSMAVTNCSPAEAAGRRRTARLMGLMPGVGEAFGSGTVGVAQVGELARLTSNARAREHLPGSAGVLLEAARTLSFEDFKLVLAQWLVYADSDGTVQRAERTHEQRTASLVSVGDGYEWHTSHGVIDGQIMQQVFDAFVEAEFQADWDTCVAEHGIGACAALLPRTARQRRADAMVALFEAAATAGTDDVPIAINLNLVMDEDQYEQRLAGAIDGTPVEIDPATVRERHCHTTDGVAVDPRTIVALSVLAHVRRIVVNSAGIVVNAGMKRRLFDGALAEVIRAIEPRCIWLGCMLRVTIAQIDHLIDFSAGGPTDAENAGVVCQHHNLFKYRRRYRPQRQPDGTWTLRRPDGTEIAYPDAPAA